MASQLRLDIPPEQSEGAFGLTLAVKDKNGKLTGEMKTLNTDDPNALWEFWIKHQPRKKKNKPHNKQNSQDKRYKEVLPNAKEAESLLTQLVYKRAPKE